MIAKFLCWLGIACSASFGAFQPISIPAGGTGTTTVPAYGKVLVGNGVGYDLTATSSLGIMSGVTSLGGQTGATQTFANDTNVAISSSGNIHTLGWVGTLADDRITSASTWNAKESTLTFTYPLQRSSNTISTALSTSTTLSSVSTNGFLSSSDWTIFNNKQAALGFTPANSIVTLTPTYPLTGGGDLSTNRTFSLAFGTTTANTFSALNIFTNASSTRFSVNETFYSGGTATTSIFSSGKMSIAGASTTPQRDIVFKSASTVECNLTDGATVTFDLSTCNQGRVVLGGNRTLDFTNQNQALGQGIRFVVCQDGTGSRTLTWDSAIRWAGGTAPTLTTTANKCDVIAGFTTAATSTTVILLDKSLNF